MDEEILLRHLAAAFNDAMINLDQPLTLSLPLEDIAELDSISRTRLMLSIEDIFKIEMPLSPDDIVITVGDLLTLVRSRIETKAP